ncbi:MAG: manganese transport protein [Thermoleophilaceae bacterium]|nr:manganese transport protein [Thermoleophilaceae bacterium]
MKKVFQIALGIIAAIGGFVDIGDLVFNAQAGATFGYKTLWAVPFGVLGIMVFAEMSGRVAAITQKANFELVNDHFSRRLATFALIASLVVSTATLGAELGGLGIALNLFFDVSDQFFTVLALVLIMAASFLLPFSAIERIFGYMGLALLVFIAAALKLGPDWGATGEGFVPHSSGVTLYWYFIVGLVAAALMPYEIYFYSGGAIEEGWTKKDLGINRLNAILGYGLGGLLAVGILVTAAETLHVRGINPGSLGTTALTTQIPYGELGLVLALIGIAFAIGGAAIDTAFSAAYNLSQHMGWKWGKRNGLRGKPQFTLALLGAFLLGFVIVSSGINPIDLTEYAVVFSALAMPFTFLPVVLTGNSRELMGEHRNGVLTRGLGWIYFGVVCIVAVAAPVLLIVTNGGGG